MQGRSWLRVDREGTAGLMPCCAQAPDERVGAGECVGVQPDVPLPQDPKPVYPQHVKPGGIGDISRASI